MVIFLSLFWGGFIAWLCMLPYPFFLLLFLLLLMLLSMFCTVQILTRLYTLFLFDFISIIELYFTVRIFGMFYFFYYFLFYIPSHNLKSFFVFANMCVCVLYVFFIMVLSNVKLMVNWNWQIEIGDDVRTVIDRSKIE